LQGAPIFSVTAPTFLGPVNNCEQFASDLLDGSTHGAVEHLGVHIQRDLDVGVAHELSDHLAGYAFVVSYADGLVKVGTQRVIAYSEIAKLMTEAGLKTPSVDRTLMKAASMRVFA
jgi:hypothetical protein